MRPSFRNATFATAIAMSAFSAYAQNKNANFPDLQHPPAPWVPANDAEKKTEQVFEGLNNLSVLVAINRPTNSDADVAYIESLVNPGKENKAEIIAFVNASSTAFKANIRIASIGTAHSSKHEIDEVLALAAKAQEAQSIVITSGGLNTQILKYSSKLAPAQDPANPAAAGLVAEMSFYIKALYPLEQAEAKSLPGASQQRAKLEAMEIHDLYVKNGLPAVDNDRELASIVSQLISGAEIKMKTDLKVLTLGVKNLSQKSGLGEVAFYAPHSISQTIDESNAAINSSFRVLNSRAKTILDNKASENFIAGITYNKPSPQDAILKSYERPRVTGTSFNNPTQ